MAYASRAGRARTSSRSPQAHAICDRCGFRYNHVALRFQYEWAGAALYNTQMLVCQRCLDVPQQQLRSVILPADPMPIPNPRFQNFVAASQDTRTTSGQNGVDFWTGIPTVQGDTRITQNNHARVTQQTGEPPGGLNQQPGTDPNAPGDDDPGLPYDNTEVPETGPLS